jgi:pyruvate kinase
MSIDADDPQYEEAPFAKTRIIATVGPACWQRDQLRSLVLAGVDVFRLNFAHADYATLDRVVSDVRSISADPNRPLGLLGDLGGPKIRLGELPAEGLDVQRGATYAFVRKPVPGNPAALTATYDGLIDDLDKGDSVLLADGTVALRVVEKHPDRVDCVVEQPGLLRSRQGINLPGVKLRMPSVTDKDEADLKWALAHGLDFIGLSFVRSADDIRHLRQLIEDLRPAGPPWIVAKIEKPEAVAALDAILAETDAVMVARGDLGVEVDIVRVPAIQKEIIRECSRRCVPVITATQMLDSMQHNRLPTRAEASDVANAVLDGTDAVMLSGETAIGKYPVDSVTMMSRIVREAERLVVSHKELSLGGSSRNAATETTRAVTLGAIDAAEQLHAKLIVVLTGSGRTAFAISELRSPIPIVGLTDSPATARRLCLAWGVRPLVADVCQATPVQLVEFVVDWGRRAGLLQTGDRVVFVGTTNWEQTGKDLMLVHTVV